MKANKKPLFSRLVPAYVEFASKHSLKTLALFGLITLLMVYFASRLRIQTNLEVLLPEGTRSVLSLKESEKRMGSVDFFTIAFHDTSLTKVAQMQKIIADSVKKWPEAMMIQYDQDPTFFEDHALLYFPIDQLEDLRDRLQAMVDNGKKKANPFLIDLVEEDEIPANLDGWPDSIALYKQGLPMNVVGTMLRKIDEGKGVKKPQLTDSTGKGVIAEPELPDSIRSRMIGWNEDKNVWVGVVMARLNGSSTEVQFAGAMKARGEHLIQGTQGIVGEVMSAKVVGAYRDPAAEIEQVNTDMWLSGFLAIAMILGLLAFYMHRPANVGVVFLPLLVAMAWMMGSAELIFGRLTVLTSFVIALLSGLGVEYNIHIYSRWIEERRKGRNEKAAMEISLSKTGRSLVSAMIASIVCMLALQIGHFKGFKEFGLVISMGIFFAFVSAILILPPLLFAMLKMSDALRSRFGNKLNWFLPSADVAAGAMLVPKFKFSMKFVQIAFLLSMVATVFLALAPKVEFENDFKNLRGKSTYAGIRYSKAVDKGQSTRPSIILGKSEEQMREIHDQLSKRYGTPQDSMLRSFVTIASFLPSEDDQEERLEVLEDIRKIIDGPSMQKADSATRARVDKMRKYLSPDKFKFEDLPDYAQRFMIEANGEHGTVGYIYSEFRESDAIESMKFQERFEEFDTKEGPAYVASSGFIYADVVRMVRSDSGLLAIFVFLFLAIVVYLDTRSWRGLVVNLGYIGLISFWTWCMMGWLGWKIGMFNIVVIPALLSNTVDATIHLYHRRMELGAGKLSEIYHTAGSSVLAGTLTNAFGFLALCFVSHKGLQTIGKLATLGYVSGIVIMFLVMPYLLEVLCPKEPQDSHNKD